jgi:hypothetical protein
MKSKMLAALYNKLMKIHQSISPSDNPLYYLHFTFQDILVQTGIYQKYSPVVLIDTHWTVAISFCYAVHLYIKTFMLVLHFCNICHLYLHIQGGPALTGMVEGGFSHWISISIKYTCWIDNVWSSDIKTLHQHIHSFHWHVQNATIPCHSQELLPFLSVMYFFLII